MTYGRLENVIRAFLVLDFLVHLEGEGAKERSEIEEEFLNILGKDWNGDEVVEEQVGFVLERLIKI